VTHCSNVEQFCTFVGDWAPRNEKALTQCEKGCELQQLLGIQGNVMTVFCTCCYRRITCECAE